MKDRRTWLLAGSLLVLGWWMVPAAAQSTSDVECSVFVIRNAELFHAKKQEWQPRDPGHPRSITLPSGFKPVGGSGSGTNEHSVVACR